jgi:hypothetical protein
LRSTWNTTRDFCLSTDVPRGTPGEAARRRSRRFRRSSNIADSDHRCGLPGRRVFHVEHATRDSSHLPPRPFHVERLPRSADEIADFDGVFHVERPVHGSLAGSPFHVERPVRPPGDGVAVPVDPRNFRQRSIDVACAADGRHSCSTWNTRHEIPRTCPPGAFHVEPLPRSADEIADFDGVFHVERPVHGSLAGPPFHVEPWTSQRAQRSLSGTTLTLRTLNLPIVGRTT